MKGFVVRGKTARGRTDFTIDRLEELHRRDPFSYFLLGPTASFTESVRQELLLRGYSLLSDRFVPVWSLARWLASSSDESIIRQWVLIKIDKPYCRALFTCIAVLADTGVFQ